MVPAEHVTPAALCSNPGVAAKLEQERMLKAGITAHKTGLPKKLLELFAPLPPLPHKVCTDPPAFMEMSGHACMHV